MPPTTRILKRCIITRDATEDARIFLWKATAAKTLAMCTSRINARRPGEWHTATNVELETERFRELVLAACFAKGLSHELPPGSRAVLTITLAVDESSDDSERVPQAGGDDAGQEVEQRPAHRPQEGVHARAGCDGV